MVVLTNPNLSLTFQAARGGGLALGSLYDPISRHAWLSGAVPLFAYAVNNGPLRLSDADLVIKQSRITTRSLFILAESKDEHEALVWSVWISLGRVDPVARVRVQVANAGRNTTVFLRLVLPILSGIVPPGPRDMMMGMIPRELGSVAPLFAAGVMGMAFDIDVGVPTAMNMMEVASIYDANGGGGLFVADIGGNVQADLPPIQLTLSALELTGFWVSHIVPGGRVEPPPIVLGVYPKGDWREAIDWYLRLHPPPLTPTDIPAWLRDAGAIYTFSGGGAGSIYLSEPMARLNDGAIYATWERDDRGGVWRDGLGDPARNPAQISESGLAPAGAPIAAAFQNEDQVNVFVAGRDRAIWTSWEYKGSAWRDGRISRDPVDPARITAVRDSGRITPAGGLVPPAAYLATANEPDQLDVFWAGTDGAIWMTWVEGSGQWQDGANGRHPRRVTPTQVAMPGKPIAAAFENPQQLDVFWVHHDGAVWMTWKGEHEDWRNGDASRLPKPLTKTELAPPGSPVIAIEQFPGQLDVFVVGRDEAIWVAWEKEGRREATPVTPFQFVPVGAHLAAARQRDDRLVVFFIGGDGAIWATWEDGNGAWRDGVDGRPIPIRVTPPEVATPGSHLAAGWQNAAQLNVFFIGKNHGNVCVTWAGQDTVWRDDANLRPPLAISPPGFAHGTAGLATATRSDGQMEVYAVAEGRIRSFTELPRLLCEAKELGTNIVYLWDFWEGSDEGGYPPYWNKGDYFPRGDLGGEAAFIRGVRDLHNDGGRVIVYLEPFILYKFSDTGRAVGHLWEGLHANDQPFVSYPDNYTMVPNFVAWQNHIVSVARRLVGTYGVDGIFLDSCAWQMNRALKARVEGRFYSEAESSRGVLELAARIRREIRSIKADAVVLGETTAGPISEVWDGGLSADFDDKVWPMHRTSNANRLMASPVRYGMPRVNFYSNGLDLRELHQVFAAGHSLALCNNWPGSFMFEHRVHIKRLVELRQQYSDALIHGLQEYQPAANYPNIIAFYFRGTKHQVITVVNTDLHSRPTTVLTLRGEHADTAWEDVRVVETTTMPGAVLYADGTRFDGLSLEGGDIKVLVNRPAWARRLRKRFFLDLAFSKTQKRRPLAPSHR